MIRHYLKITIRALFRNKIHSIINITGLSLGIACAILIILFVKDELTFDRFHSKANSIYRITYTGERQDGSKFTSPFVPMIAGKVLNDNFQEIDATTVWTPINAEVQYEDKSFSEAVNLASSSFFNMFDFSVQEGSLKNALSNTSGIVITQSTAKKIFGNEDAIGKTITLILGGNKRPFEVKAVLKDVPSNSSFQFNYVINAENGKDVFPAPVFTGWNMVVAEGYVLLKKGVDSRDLEKKFPDVIKVALGDQKRGQPVILGLQPLTDIHLNTKMPAGIAPVSDPKYTMILSGIAALILLMACVNFVNLSLGRSLARAREIGVKKVVGALRFQLIIQFLGESVLLAFISLVAGLAIAYWALPMFNELSGKELIYNLSTTNIFIFVLLALLVGISSGIYPALVLSGFLPAKILKGQIGVGTGRQGIRKGMITLQLVLSIFLITSTLFMKNQLDFLRNKNLGFNRDQVMTIPMVVDGRGVSDIINKGMDKAERSLARLKSLPEVEDVAISAQAFGEGGWMQLGYNDPDNTLHQFSANVVDYNYIKTMGMEIVKGRDFLPDNESDKRRSIIVNEAFVKEFNLEDPIGKRIPNDRFEDHEIIGVVKDFNFASLHSKIGPLVLSENIDLLLSGVRNLNIESPFNPKLVIRLKAGQVGNGLEDIRSQWQSLYSGDPFNYSFVDDAVNRQYLQDGNLGKIVTTATVLSIIIGSLGLFGLATLTMSARMKEISIRKVLGANFGNLILVLTRSYLVLTVAAIFIAIPLVLYFITNWLKSFEFKIDISPWTFILGGIIMVIISSLAVAYQSIRIAGTNPVKNLRSE